MGRRLAEGVAVKACANACSATVRFACRQWSRQGKGSAAKLTATGCPLCPRLSPHILDRFLLLLQGPILVRVSGLGPIQCRRRDAADARKKIDPGVVRLTLNRPLLLQSTPSKE
jgi:hypothetical protein